MKKVSLILMFLLLSGCAEDYLAAGLPQLEGQPLSVAVQYFGPPTEKHQEARQTTYTWSREETSRYYVPETVSGPDVIRADRGGGFAVYPGTSAYYTEREYIWHCRVEIVAENGIIIDAQYHGDGAGCRRFNKQIRPLALTPRDRQKSSQQKP
ncbi:MAG: hypothetical protein HY052_01350 [Proteobacteria bacterium]|nr:hypothetical protein [Pseudomonadota bacterium]